MVHEAGRGMKPVFSPFAYAAKTINEAKAEHKDALDLSHTHLKELPKELSSLNKLTCLNLSENSSLTELSAVLPVSLKELWLTGCALTSLPSVLTKLHSLEKLYAGGNRIGDFDLITKLPRLQHVGLAYNPICEIPSLSQCQVISLDLSYCQLEQLDETLLALAALPRLQALQLIGNPIALQPGYSQALRSGWARRLLVLDSQRQDVGGRPVWVQCGPDVILLQAIQAAAAQPDNCPAAIRALIEPHAPGCQHPDTLLRVSFSKLQIQPDLDPQYDPWAQARTTWTAAAAAAQASGAPPDFSLPAPLQPCYYHFELEGCDGKSIEMSSKRDVSLSQTTTTMVHTCVLQQLEQQLKDQQGQQEQSEPSDEASPDDTAATVDTQDTAAQDVIPAWHNTATRAQHLSLMAESAATQYCSIPLRVATPVPPGADPGAAATAPKAPDDKKGKAGAAAGKGSKPTTPIADPTPVATLERGTLDVLLGLSASVQARDWLMRGLRLRLYCTRVTAVLKPGQTAPPPPPATPPKDAKGAKGKAVPEDTTPRVDMSAYNLESHTQLVAEAVIPTAALICEAAHQVSDAKVPFIPCPQLWDAQGIRMPLKDVRHTTKPIAHVAAHVQLHALPPGWIPPPEPLE